MCPSCRGARTDHLWNAHWRYRLSIDEWMDATRKRLITMMRWSRQQTPAEWTCGLLVEVGVTSVQSGPLLRPWESGSGQCRARQHSESGAIISTRATAEQIACALERMSPAASWNKVHHCTNGTFILPVKKFLCNFVKWRSVNYVPLVIIIPSPTIIHWETVYIVRTAL